MTVIWNGSGFVTGDPWDMAGDGNGRKLLSVADAIEMAGATGSRGGDPIGVTIEPGDDVMRLKPCIGLIGIVVLTFPVFSDGRAFSHASLLRERLGYRGEIRATGAVLIDQIPLMLRVGIDSVGTSHRPTIVRLAENRLPGIDLHYQPAAAISSADGGFSWRRRSRSRGQIHEAHSEPNMHICVTDRQGKRHRLEALEGFRVMEIIRDWGLDIKAECGGACACATCHVYVAEPWLDRLAEKSPEEDDMLDQAFQVMPNSRLSCQLLMNEDLDGLEVTLAPGTGKDEVVAA